MRYILYARKSSESEDRQVQSIDDQLRVLRELADRKGLEIVVELTEAHSAKAPGTRRVFAELLDRIMKEEADGILTWSINRLSRNPVDSGQISWLLQLGTLKSIQTIDREYQPEDNTLIMAVETGVANQYIIDLRKAVIRGMDGKAKRGWFPGKPPQGYRVNAETREIEPYDPQFTLLRQAWDLLLTGTYTVPQIREKLSAWGYSAHPRKGDRRIFSESHLYRLFDNPFYYGTFLYKGEEFCGNHQPMVSREEFKRAQSIIHGEMHVQAQKHEFAFTGLIRCGTCGCSITAERKIKNYLSTKRTAVYEYYRCTKRRGSCSECCVTGKQIEDSIAASLDSYAIKPDWKDWLAETIHEYFMGESGKDRLKNLSQRSAQEECDKKLDGLIEMRLARELTQEEYQRKRTQLIEAKHQLDEEAKRHETERKALISALGFLSTSSERFKLDDPKLKRQVAITFGMKYVLTQGTLKVSPHPILSIVNGLELQKEGQYMVGSGSSASLAPLKWALRKRFRTLLPRLSLYDLRFVDATFFDKDGKPIKVDGDK